MDGSRGGDHGASADIQERTTAAWWTGREEGDDKYQCIVQVSSRAGKTKWGNQMTSKLICDGRKEGEKWIVKRRNQGKLTGEECVSSNGREGSLLRKDDIRVGMGER